MATATQEFKNAEAFSKQYEDALKRAVASSNTPYEPGTLARYYNSVPKHMRESVNQEANRIFAKLTGITRPLSKSAKDEKPRRQWFADSRRRHGSSIRVVGQRHGYLSSLGGLSSRHEQAIVRDRH